MDTPSNIGETTVRDRQWLLAVLVLLVSVLGLYWPVLARLIRQWWEDPSYSYAFLVPLFVGYLLWRSRSRWQAVMLNPRNAGLVVMFSGLALLLAGSLAAELFISRISLMVLLAGIVLFIAGRQMLRVLAFPLTYLLFAIPLPAIVYNQITFPLQLQASRFAATSLELLRIPVLREGNLLVLPNYTLEVVEACSGIRSLMSLLALGVAYGYLMENSYRIRVLLVALIIPIAIVSNGLRVVMAGVLAYLLGPSWAEGFFHFFAGWLIFLAALALVLLVHSLLRRFGHAVG